MRIIVCVKQVPDPENAKMDWEKGTVVREGVQNIINPFDLYAIEEAIRIKESLGGEVIVISMGPPQAEDALREAIAMGADQAYLVTSRAFAGADTLATSYTLSKTIETIDGDTAQVGPGIATQLDIPQITFVKKIDEIDEKHIKAERMIEGGLEILEAPLPCLITVVKDINTPRLPSLKGKIKAKKAEIIHFGPEDINADPMMIGEKGSPTSVMKIYSPEIKKEGMIFKAEEIDKALEEVIKKIKKVGVI